MIAKSYCAWACDSLLMWERDGLEGIIISFIRSTGIIGRNGEEECVRSCCFFSPAVSVWCNKSHCFFSLQILLLLNQRLLLPVQVFLWFSLSRYVQLCLYLPVFFQRPTPSPAAGFWLSGWVAPGSSATSAAAAARSLLCLVFPSVSFLFLFPNGRLSKKPKQNTKPINFWHVQ